jgi:hypothetical protein
MRKAIAIQIHPMNGQIVALCDDGSVWVHDGAAAALKKPWKRLTDVPAIDAPPPVEEPEEEATTLV